MRNTLTLADREKISRVLAEGLGCKEIAQLIGQNPSVVSRDVAPHGGPSGYRVAAAEESAAAGRSRPKVCAVDRSPRLQAVVTELSKVAGRRRRVDQLIGVVLRRLAHIIRSDPTGRVGIPAGCRALQPW